MRRAFALMLFLMLMAMCTAGQEPTNLVANGSFELDADGDGLPDGWRSYGREGMVIQRLSTDIGRDGGKCASLICTHFEGGYPDCHAMIAQVGVVSVKRGKWYRLRFWARGDAIKGSVARVALVDTSNWESCGLRVNFRPRALWRQFEFTFQCTRTASKTTRLQFWFNSTGTLWLDDVELVEIPPPKRRYNPMLNIEGCINYIPNSSFECGSVGWSSYSPEIPSWGGNVAQLIGEVTTEDAVHGRASLRIRIDTATAPVFFFDYFDLHQIPIKVPLTANIGWMPLERGKPYTLSAYMRADKPDVQVIMLVRYADANSSQRIVKLTTNWQRYSFAFKAMGSYAHIAIGPDLKRSKMDSATVWLDAIQLEAGEVATHYRPRRTVEAFCISDAAGNIFTNLKKVNWKVVAYNDSESVQTIHLQFRVTDFDDKVVLQRSQTYTLPQRSQRIISPNRLLPTKLGFFRIRMQGKTTRGDAIDAQELRTAIIRPYMHRDSLFGMNHAYPWEHLLRLAKRAGVLWWRDWSVKWQFVEPQRGQFDFTHTDPQVNRVLKLNMHVLMLFPFPSSYWSSSAPAEILKKAMGGGYTARRLAMAFKPKRVDDFARYVAVSVQHYRTRITAFEILNEPIYTTYALPQRYGHKLEDYIKLLAVAYKAAKQVYRDCIIVGGIAAGPAHLTKRLIEAGALKYLDVLNLHTYPGIVEPEVYEEDMRELLSMMDDAGMRKPIWVTEYGYYADDDPPIVPYQPRFPKILNSERECSSYMVRYTAMMLAHGVSKIFYHAGSCGSINRDSVQSIFFEHDGTPRKMFATQAAMAHLLPPETLFVRKLDWGSDVRCYIFRNRHGFVAIAWQLLNEPPIGLRLGNGIYAVDLMGNTLPVREVRLSEAPLYLVGKLKDLRLFIRRLHRVRR